MNFLIAKRIVLPWTLLFASMLSILLYVLSGGVLFPEIAKAAQPLDASNQVSSDNQFVDVADSGCSISQSYPGSIQQWCQLITYYSASSGLHPDLLAALIWQESGGNALAYSKSGAVGLMQVMPRDGLAASFRCPNGPCFHDRPSINELQDAEFNVAYGTEMLANLLNKYGNIRDALKFYGPMDVGYYYADKVLGIYKQYGNN